METITQDGLKIEYMEHFLPSEEANSIYNELSQLRYFTPTFRIMGKEYRPKRQIYAFSDIGVKYAFSGTTVEGNFWTPTIRALREKVEIITGCQYNFALLNYYHSGASSIGAHRDDEKNQNENIPIPTILLGARRNVIFSKPNQESVSLKLEYGSLYSMEPPTNLH